MQNLQARGDQQWLPKTQDANFLNVQSFDFDSYGYKHEVQNPTVMNSRLWVKPDKMQLYLCYIFCVYNWTVGRN